MRKPAPKQGFLWAFGVCAIAACLQGTSTQPRFVEDLPAAPEISERKDTTSPDGGLFDVGMKSDATPDSPDAAFDTSEPGEIFVDRDSASMDAHIGMDAVRDDRDGTADRTVVPRDAGPFMGAVRQLALSDLGDSSCAVLMNGEVYCWGGDSYINPASSYEEAAYAWQVAGLRNIVHAGVTWGIACVVDREGAVWCWGENYLGALMTGNPTDPLRVPGQRMDVRGAGHVSWVRSSLFVQRTDGTLFVRDHLRSTPPYNFLIPSPAIDVKTDTVSYCVLLADGRVACYGNYISSVLPWTFPDGPRVMPGLDNVIGLSMGGGTYCALKRDATVWCWGEASGGRAGIPPSMAERCSLGLTSGEPPAEIFTSCLRTPRQVPGLTDVVEIASGLLMTCARKRDGSVWCWGINSSIGDGLPPNELCENEPWIPASRTPPPIQCRPRPTRVVGLAGATTIAVGGGYACAALNTGQIRCWGSNSGRELGDGTRTYRETPVPVLVLR